MGNRTLLKWGHFGTTMRQRAQFSTLTPLHLWRNTLRQLRGRVYRGLRVTQDNLFATVWDIRKRTKCRYKRSRRTTWHRKPSLPRRIRRWKCWSNIYRRSWEGFDIPLLRKSQFSSMSTIQQSKWMLSHQSQSLLYISLRALVVRSILDTRQHGDITEAVGNFTGINLSDYW